MKVYLCIEFIDENNKPTDIPDFFPFAAKTPWDAAEILPITEIENGVCEVTQEGNESFWSVYLHQIDGCLKCVADVNSRVEAELLADLIEQCSNTKIHSSFR